MELCDRVARQLSEAAHNVIELYRRFDSSDSNVENDPQQASIQTTDMFKNFELSVSNTLKKLCNENQSTTIRRLNELMSRRLENDQSALVSGMHQYSDILIELVTQKIQNSNT